MKPTKEEIINYLVDCLGYSENDAREYNIDDLDENELENVIAYNRG